MALHLTLEDHDSDPPAGWVPKLAGRRWRLLSRTGGVIDTLHTKRDAENAKTSGHLVDLYDREGRWFKGELIPGWRPYVTREQVPS